MVKAKNKNKLMLRKMKIKWINNLMKSKIMKKMKTINKVRIKRLKFKILQTQCNKKTHKDQKKNKKKKIKNMQKIVNNIKELMEEWIINSKIIIQSKINK